MASGSKCDTIDVNILGRDVLDNWHCLTVLNSIGIDVNHTNMDVDDNYASINVHGVKLTGSPMVVSVLGREPS